MKICHLTSVHAYNDIRIYLKECTSLEKAGFEVHLIAPNTKSKMIKGIHVHGLSNPYKGRIKRFRKFTKEIFIKALEINADIYHIHDPELIPSALKLNKKGKSIIYDVHEDLPRAILSKYWIPKILRKLISFIVERYENRASKKFDYIIGATPFITERFKRINTNSVNINNYPFLEELVTNSINQNKSNQVCYIGGISSIRGVENILSSAKTINGKIVLAGKPSSPELERKTINSNVEYLGMIKREEVAVLLNESVAGLVLFLPEPNHINSQPNKMFEYMSAGICVIASDFKLWREIIEKNKCGICVDPLDEEEISKTIQWVLDNSKEAKIMGENGRKAIEKKYNWESESIKLIQVYEELRHRQYLISKQDGRTYLN